jgi:hypothetical protein
MADITLDAHELDRLDLFATQQLLKLVATTVLRWAGDPEAGRRVWAQDVERLVAGFDLRDTPADKAEVAREYMLNVALELLSQCRPQSDAQAVT